MSYTPNTWATGDTITAEKLNNMEQGIASAGGELFLVNIIQDSETLDYAADKTYAEIMAAHSAGKVCVFNINDSAIGTGMFMPPEVMPNAPIYVTGGAFVSMGQTNILQLQSVTIASDNAVVVTTGTVTVTPVGS